MSSIRGHHTVEYSRRHERRRGYKRCHQCGHAVRGGYTFCPKCRDANRKSRPPVEFNQRPPKGPYSPETPKDTP